MHFPSRWYCCGISCVFLQRQLDVGLGSFAIVGQGALQSLLLPILLTIFFPPFHSVSSYTLLSSNMPDPVAFLFLIVSENSVIFQNHVWEKGNKQAY